jgi:hypothetical protein
MIIGIGLIVLALLGGVTAFARLLGRGNLGDSSTIFTVGGALVIMVITGAALIGASGNRGAQGALKAGCTSALAVLGILLMMFVALVIFVLHQCFTTPFRI